MNTGFRKLITLNGIETHLTPYEIEYFNRYLYITGEINDTAAEEINVALRCLDRDSNEDITIVFQSPGGSISSGFSIYDTIKSLHSDVHTVASGMAASMAAFLVCCAGTKGKRWIQPNAEMMIHQPLGGTSGQATDLQIHVEHILKTKNKINNMLAKATNQSLEQIEYDTERDFFMDATQALEYGLVDRIGFPANNNKENKDDKKTDWSK